MNRILLLAVSLLLLLATASAQAETRIHLLVPPSNPAYDDLAKAIRHALSRLQPAPEIIIVTPVEMAEVQQTVQPADLLVAIGEPVLRWARSPANRFHHTLHFHISSTAHAAAAMPAGDVSALFRDQPLARQLALAQLLVPEAEQIVMLLDGTETPPDFAELQQRSNVRFTLLNIGAEANWPRQLSELMISHDLLLAHDDPDIYNRATVRSLLLTTYHHGKVIIGPSRPFVEAGSFASVYTSSEQHLRQLTRAVTRFLAEGRLRPPQFPTEFSVIVNRQAAASLGLKAPGETTIAHQLHALEAAP